MARYRSQKPSAAERHAQKILSRHFFRKSNVKASELRKKVLEVAPELASFEKWRILVSYALRLPGTFEPVARKVKPPKPLKVTPKVAKSGKDNFLESYEWRRVRMVAIKRAGARCECCGATPKDGIVINVDHIKPRAKHPELALDPDNLQVLCNVCNHGNGNWDDTDWREKA